MTNRVIVGIGYCIIGFAVLTTVVIYKMKLGVRISSLFHLWPLLFYFWDLLPYIVMGYSLKLFSESKSRVLFMDCIAIFFTSAIGLYLMWHVIFYESDPQAPIALLFIPAIQIITYGIWGLLFGFIEWFLRRTDV